MDVQIQEALPPGKKPLMPNVEMKRVVIPEIRYVKISIVFKGMTAQGPARQKVEGEARCHPNDVFDVEIGTEIAYARALQKILGMPKRLKWKPRCDQVIE